MIVRRLERVPVALCQLLFRLAVASVFFRAGLAKLTSWEPTVALFRDECRVPVLSPEVYPSAWPEHLTWASILVFLFTHGAGAFSFDRLIGRPR